MVEVKDFLRELQRRIDEAKKDKETASELIKVAEEAGLDVSTQKADISDLTIAIERMESAIKKRLK